MLWRYYHCSTRPLNLPHHILPDESLMNAIPPYHSSRGPSSCTIKHYDALVETQSLRQINPMRPCPEYRASHSDFALRPVSRSPPVIPESSNAMLRAQARADALHRAVKSASSKRTPGAFSQVPYYSESSRCSTPSAPRPAERFPPPPTLSVFNAPTATFLWPNFQASSQMKHGPILYARYHDMPSPSSCSDSEDSQLESEDLHSPSSSDRGTVHTPREHPSHTFDELPSAFRRRESSVELQSRRLNTPPVNRNVSILDSERHASPESSNCSEYATGKFDIGFPPRQDHRTSFAVVPSVGSHHPSLSAASSVESDQMSPLNSRPTPTQLPSAPVPNQNWENHAIQIRNPEGGIAYKCTWSTPEGPCHYWSKKQLVKRHVETTHLKFKPFVCDICSKAFPQKTSLEIHRHGHTGDTPHQCIYKCGKSFKDPARRHRHHVESHGYVPKQGKKKQQGAGTQMQEPSPYESLPPLRMNSDTDSASSRG
ncbi:hypothetical protein B0H17DRAFT_277884 [Mycena rosella]|uniref:C2H2-type domain-containing protein n=1 Tax=Mycena rosella TaxID=1033263 RepID=A0AAD7GPX4_MYCRO|nr:hypothetical protein B0H17DRAFT_277884 [Mycena rosella]